MKDAYQYLVKSDKMGDVTIMSVRLNGTLTARIKQQNVGGSSRTAVMNVSKYVVYNSLHALPTLFAM